MGAVQAMPGQARPVQVRGEGGREGGREGGLRKGRK
jgi:hypothetical protein